MQRRDFITILGGTAAVWPLAAGAQVMPVVGFLDIGTADASADRVRAFRKGLGETGYIEAQNGHRNLSWSSTPKLRGCFASPRRRCCSPSLMR
jgi:putative ABC transport system substrate-binding protein